MKGNQKIKDVPITRENFYGYSKHISNENYADANTDYILDSTEETSPTPTSPITIQEIFKCICKLINNKSSGNDYIVNECIKTTRDVMGPCM